MIQHLNDKFGSLYYAGQEVAIDETLLKSQGRLSFAQKIKTKAVKIYELCESSSGYLWKFIVYTGKDGHNATAKIVYDLIGPLRHCGHTLIMDNFYNSPLLARCLKRDEGTDVFGTLRLNREFVPDSIKTLTKSNIRQGYLLQRIILRSGGYLLHRSGGHVVA